MHRRGWLEYELLCFAIVNGGLELKLKLKWFSIVEEKGGRRQSIMVCLYSFETFLRLK